MFSTNSVTMAVTPAWATAVTAMPVSASRSGDTPFFQARAYTRAPVAAPPNSAAKGTAAKGAPGTARIITTATRPAPAVTPMMSGDASALRVTPWRSAPETASWDPTRTARTILGSRKSKRIVLASASSAVQKARNTLDGATSA